MRAGGTREQRVRIRISVSAALISPQPSFRKRIALALEKSPVSIVFALYEYYTVSVLLLLYAAAYCRTSSRNFLRLLFSCSIILMY